MSAKGTLLDRITDRTNDSDVVRDRDREVPARKARENFSRVLDVARVRRDRVVITDHDTPAAAVVPLRDLRVLDWLRSLELTDKTAELAYRNASKDQFIAELIGQAEKSYGRLDSGRKKRKY